MTRIISWVAILLVAGLAVSGALIARSNQQAGPPPAPAGATVRESGRWADSFTVGQEADLFVTITNTGQTAIPHLILWLRHTDPLTIDPAASTTTCRSSYDATQVSTGSDAIAMDAGPMRPGATCDLVVATTPHTAGNFTIGWDTYTDLAADGTPSGQIAAASYTGRLVINAAP